MAYLEKEKVAEIRKIIRSTFPSKEGWKISVSREDYSGINVNVMRSPLRFSSNNKPINDFYTDQLENEHERAVFGIMNKIITRVTGGCYNRNAGDPSADYADFNYFKHFRIGKWDKNCEFVNC